MVVFIRLGGLFKNLLAVSDLYSPYGLEEKRNKDNKGAELMTLEPNHSPADTETGRLAKPRLWSRKWQLSLEDRRGQERYCRDPVTWGTQG